MLLAAVLLTFFAPCGARADSTMTYSFSGTLTNGVNGNSAVSGQFTLDTTNATITAFDFTTPIGDINSASWFPTVFTFTPAFAPPMLARLPTINPYLALLSRRAFERRRGPWHRLAVSLDNLPGSNQRREVESDNVHL